MRDNKNDWMDTLLGDDLRNRLGSSNPIPARDPPKAKKKSLRSKFKTPKLKKLDKPVNVEKAKSQGSKVEVSVNLSIPKVPLKKYARRYKSSTYAKIMSVIIAVILVNVIAVSVVKKNNSSNDVKGAVAGQDGKSKSPDYKPLLPSGTAANTVSGNFSYDSEKKVTSFSDKIGEEEVTISQQPLPQDFKDNPDGRVEIFAKNANFNELIQTKSGRAHIGTSIKGPQSVVFHREGLLVFLRSEKKILNTDWVRYIDSLQPAKQ